MRGKIIQVHVYLIFILFSHLIPHQGASPIQIFYLFILNIEHFCKHTLMPNYRNVILVIHSNYIFTYHLSPNQKNK